MPDSISDTPTQPLRESIPGNFYTPYQIEITTSDTSNFVSTLESIVTNFESIANASAKNAAGLMVIWMNIDVLDGEESMKIYATQLQARRILERIKASGTDTCNWIKLKTILKEMHAIPLSGEERAAIKAQTPLTWRDMNKSYRDEKGLEG